LALVAAYARLLQIELAVALDEAGWFQVRLGIAESIGRRFSQWNLRWPIRKSFTDWPDIVAGDDDVIEPDFAHVAGRASVM
jgi:hypothetical protein